MPGKRSTQKSSKAQDDEDVTGSPESRVQMDYVLDSKTMTLQSNRKQGHYKNIVHLWEFLLELLEKETCRSIVTWTRKDVWEFKIQNSRELAERWGSFKKNSQMNYEHLSRSLRYYYKKGILHKVPNKKLTYRFHKLPYNYVPGVTRSHHHGARLGACISQPGPNLTRSRYGHRISELLPSELSGAQQQNGDWNSAYIMQQGERQAHATPLQANCGSGLTSDSLPFRTTNSPFPLIPTPPHTGSCCQHPASPAPFSYSGSKIRIPVIASTITSGLGPVVLVNPVKLVIPATPVAAVPTTPAIQVSVIKRII